MDVQTQAWRNSLSHLPKPQSKGAVIFTVANQKQRSNRIFFGHVDVHTQDRRKSLLHLPKPQPKHTFIFTAATPKQDSSMAAFAPLGRNNWGLKAVCLAWCNNVQCAHASRSRIAHSAFFASAHTVHAAVRSHKTL